MLWDYSIRTIINGRTNAALFSNAANYDLWFSWRDYYAHANFRITRGSSWNSVDHRTRNYWYPSIRRTIVGVNICRDSRVSARFPCDTFSLKNYARIKLRVRSPVKSFGTRFIEPTEESVWVVVSWNSRTTVTINRPKGPDAYLGRLKVKSFKTRVTFDKVRRRI